MNNTVLYLALGFFACGIGMQILFALIGGPVAQDGTLKEPFFLVPNGLSILLYWLRFRSVCLYAKLITHRAILIRLRKFWPLLKAPTLSLYRVGIASVSRRFKFSGRGC